MSKHVLIIAEAGVNHNGSIKLAKELINTAANIGVDFIKFQTFKAEKLVCKNTRKANYQIENMNSNETQFEMLKKLELKHKDHLELIEHCKMKGVKFLSTPFDNDAIDYLDNLGIELFKVSSGDVTNFPFLKKIGSKNKKVIISTGMSNIIEVENAINTIISSGTRREMISVLHCNTEYPTPFCDVNLNAMLTIKKQLNVNVGYSDHTLGIEVPIAAVAMGATIIEKHFTLDKTMEGPDHKASLEPHELKLMVESIRNIEQALGSGIKAASESEKKNIEIARKSIVAQRCILEGEILSEENLTVKRPAKGINPMRWNEVIGLKAKRSFIEDELIEI